MELITKDHEVIKNLLLIIHRLKADIAEITTIYKPSMNGEIYLDHEEVCKILHISRRTLQQYRDDGILPFIQLPGKVIYKESDIMRMLEDNYNDRFGEYNV
jgi:hypothetical protein